MLTGIALGLWGLSGLAVIRRAPTSWLGPSLGAVALVAGVASLAGSPPAVSLSLAVAAASVVLSVRLPRAPADERRRLSWAALGLVAAAEAIGLVALLQASVRWPSAMEPAMLGFSLLIPVAVVASTVSGWLGRSDRVVVRTVTAGALAAVVIGVYLGVAISIAGRPDTEDRAFVGASAVAAAVAVLAALATRPRVREFVNQRVYGASTAPDTALKTFAGRMSRTIPMDELLLQLAESLHRSLRLAAAEIWTGTGGVLDRVASVPHRGEGRVTVQGEELVLMSRTSVAGNAWLQVWMPDLLRDRTERLVRVAPLLHRGELLGLIVAERAAGGLAFTDDEDGTLVDLGRQVGLALHNVRLDAELQASLRELELRNVELQASRARIVHTADESRRQIERNLHDGVQQHLVAMAVKLRIARQLAETDAERAETLLQEVGGDVETTLGELRELAHGIYPPLLRERGLGEALRAAANRSLLPLSVGVDGVGRYPVEVEAAVYFCCLEAIQNAGKYAGADATIDLRVAEHRGQLVFSVADNGNGFDTAGPVGHGFVNMRDRLGAIGGQLTLTSSLGAGATVEGTVPLPTTAAGRRD